MPNVLPIMTNGSRATGPEPFHHKRGKHRRSGAARAKPLEYNGYMVPKPLGVGNRALYALRRFARHTRRSSSAVIAEAANDCDELRRSLILRIPVMPETVRRYSAPGLAVGPRGESGENSKH